MFSPMARLPRIVVPGFPHHVTQRGNRRADIFDDDADRRKYLALFSQYQRKHGLEVYAYCLMRNHVHWIVVPKDDAARVPRSNPAVWVAPCFDAPPQVNLKPLS